MSAPVDRPFGMTATDIRDALADAADDTPGSAPTRPNGAPVIGGLDIPAAWVAFGEPREEQ